MTLPGIFVPVIIAPDENGIYDGREVARQLIRTAFQSLTPYVRGCPGCADNLFGLIANEALTELHDHRDEDGNLEWKLWTTPEAEAAAGADEAVGNHALDSHFKEAEDSTRALLRQIEASAGKHLH